MARYLLEAVLDDGQRLQSEVLYRESPLNPHSHVVGQLRGLTMVAQVAAIDLGTGEVELDLPSYARLCTRRAAA